MLVLSRKQETSVAIGTDILVTVREFGDDHVVLEAKLPVGRSLRGPEGVIETEQVADEATPGGVARGLARLKLEDDLQIGDDITIKVVELFRGRDGGLLNKVRLGIKAPPERKINRPEACGLKSPEP